MWTGFLFNFLGEGRAGPFLSSPSTCTGFLAASAHVFPPVSPHSHRAVSNLLLQALPTPPLQLNGDADTQSNSFIPHILKLSFLCSLGCSRCLWKGNPIISQAVMSSLSLHKMCCFHPYFPLLLFLRSRFRNHNLLFTICSQISARLIPFLTPSAPLVCHSPGIFPSSFSALHSHSSPTHSTNTRGRARRGRETLFTGNLM